MNHTLQSLRTFLSRISMAALLAAPSSLLGAGASDYAIGADVSFLASAEERGTVFKDDGVAKPGLEILKDNGYNWIRLRLFHTPSNSERFPLPNDLEYTIELAKKAHDLGFKFLLDFHYSDTWADPSKQFLPKAWENLTHEELVEAVFAYTRDTIVAFREAGVMPDMVQNGNEITNGMLWPHGKLPENEDNFAELVQAGINGVDAGRGNLPRPKIMVQVESSGNKAKTKRFFDALFARGVDCDVLGQSYYPWWHGSPLDLRETLNFMALEYGKEVMVVEAAYCWRPTEYKEHPGPFPETPEGQREYLETVHEILLDVPNGLGTGIFWWEPMVHIRPGSTGGIGSRGMFDDEGNALPVMDVFIKWSRGKVPQDTEGGD
ncbi:glycosyl hydrolase 53 family protein [Pelagicoccus sp. SDUM812003]|uniref:glycoside hydrolase family 53 protein n=1 Tax=Pelagicoccus sp. SDUM812003 TaxID=3041267 RepID=UPI00280C85E1|nr:glycosyl hydrolase 53 family protein [Pelagicoccus sp. SDUM812003]MDQ8205025.1 glycosyl hydrolase 53 family protein [Pelagicoccus sp. SDUM812003]